MRRLGPLGLFVICGLTAAVVAPPAQARHGGARPTTGPEATPAPHPFSLRDLLARPSGSEQNGQPELAVAVYSPDGGERFVFDRSSSPPLMRFESSTEIWVLQAQPGPRGDVIYKNDAGEPMLRATRLGGLTLFTSARPAGTAVALDGEAAPIHPYVIMSAGVLEERLVQASVRASRALQKLVVFDAPDVTPQSATLFADAGQVASDAIVVLAKRSDPRRAIDRLVKVLLTPGRRPDAHFRGGVLQIEVAPNEGVAGRPSSRRIEMVIGP